MADNLDSFRPDVFLQALKELQKEKHANEQVLKQTREEKKLLEKRLHEEMKEVAECKLANTQEMFERVRTRNEVKTVTLEELINNISEEQTKQSQQIMELENNLDLLANQFRHAKSFYTDLSIDKEITILKLKRDGMENEAVTQQDLVSQLNQKLQLLDIAKQQDEPVTLGVDEWSRGLDKQAILQLFEEERNRLHVYAEQLKHQLQFIHEENENLVQECQQMEQKDISES